MSAAEIVRTDEVQGWPLAVLRGEERPRVGHREVARRLGYADEKDLLALAGRVFGADWKLRAPYAEFRTGGRGPMGRDYLLSKNEIIRLTMRSDASDAESMQVEFADVIEAWLDGHLRAKPLPLDGTVANSARIGDDEAAVAQLRLAVRRVRLSCGYSTQRVHGYIRRSQRVSSPFAVSLHLLAHVVASLESIERREVALIGQRESRLLEAARVAECRGQTKLPFDPEVH